MSNEYLSAMPSIDYPRSSWKQHFTADTSWKHGQLVPIDCFEVLAGDSFKLDLKSLIRLNTPIVPIMSDIECEINAWFIPSRLLWNRFEDFYGANKNSAGAQTATFTIPQVSLFSKGVPWNSTCAYLGKPVTAANSAKTSYGKASILKERGYYFIWSEFYRASMIQNPFIMNVTSSSSIGNISSEVLGTDHGLVNVCKNMDYFVAALTSPQYGSSAVTLPLGTTAPVIVKNESSATTAPSGVNIVTAEVIAPGDVGLVGASGLGSNGLAYADLSQATAATINSIRNAFAVQRYLETGNYGGNFFWSILKAHYGVTPPDASLQRPQRLGTCNFKINIAQVTAMADTTMEGAVKPAGSTGAVSVTGNSCHLFTKAFVEPGYVYILLHTRQSKQSYTQGLQREDTKKERLEFYSPEFANLGDQEIKNKEIYLSGTGDDEGTFGYQEHWAEYRYRPNRATGILNPSAGAGIAIPYWTLTNKFDALPQLNSQFVEESRDNIARCLITGSESTHDYIGDFEFNYTAVREMPVHTVPGLLDHFGNR